MQRRKAAGGKFTLTESYGGGSDHLALIAAFEGWRAAKGSGCEKEFCDRFFVNGGTMNMLQVRGRNGSNKIATLEGEAGRFWESESVTGSLIFPT